MKKNKGAFTIFEIVVVVVILGIFAALAIPRLTKSNERMIFSEGEQILITLFASQKRHFEETGGWAMDHNLLDVMPMTSQHYTIWWTVANDQLVASINRGASYFLRIDNAGIIYCDDNAGPHTCAQAGCTTDLGTGWFRCDN